MNRLLKYTIYLCLFALLAAYGCEQAPSADNEQQVQAPAPPAAPQAEPQAPPKPPAPTAAQKPKSSGGLTDLAGQMSEQSRPRVPQPKLNIIYSAETGGEYNPCPT